MRTWNYITRLLPAMVVFYGMFAASEANTPALSSLDFMFCSVPTTGSSDQKRFRDLRSKDEPHLQITKYPAVPFSKPEVCISPIVPLEDEILATLSTQNPFTEYVSSSFSGPFIIPYPVDQFTDDFYDQFPFDSEYVAPTLKLDQQPLKEKLSPPEYSVSDLIDRQVNKDPLYIERFFKESFEEKVSGTPLSGYSGLVWDSSVENSLDPYFVASIMLHETGSGTSVKLKDKNNVAGMRGSKGYMHFKTIDDSIIYFTGLLERKYIRDGLITPNQINKRYAEDNHWAEKVARWMTDLLYI